MDAFYCRAQDILRGDYHLWLPFNVMPRTSDATMSTSGYLLTSCPGRPLSKLTSPMRQAANSHPSCRRLTLLLVLDNRVAQATIDLDVSLDIPSGHPA